MASYFRYFEYFIQRFEKPIPQDLFTVMQENMFLKWETVTVYKEQIDMLLKSLKEESAKV